MKLPNSRIETFTKRPDNGVKAVLLYGPDSGLISIRSKELLDYVVEDQKDPFRIVQFNFDNIKDDPSKLADEINALSLMGGRRFIRVIDVGATINSDIQDALLSSKSDTLVVFEADELAPTSSMRKFFETESNVVALPCYKDDAISIRRVIERQLKHAGFSYDNEALSYLAHNFAGNRLVLTNELEKLITYMGDDRHITIALAKDCICDNVESSLDELCMAVALRDLTEIEKNINRIVFEGIGVIAAIRAILRYFFRLQQVSAAIADGINETQAIAALRPSLFFKQVDAFKTHLKIWNIKSINNMIEALLKLEEECKQTVNPAELFLSRFLCVVVARKKIYKT